MGMLDMETGKRLGLQPGKGHAIVPPPLSTQYLKEPEILTAAPVMRLWLRSLLVLMAVVLIAVFGIAVWLDPYGQDGEAKRMETHTQLGLPPCTFKFLTGRPCPSCGMTTSFALLLHGDFVNSLRANCVGTFLALFCLALIPYGLVSAWRGRYLFLVSLDWLVPRFIVAFAVLMLLRWGLVLWLD
jgi:hypothetical protein